MLLRATPLLLLLATFAVGAPTLAAQSAGIDRNCTRERTKSPRPEKPKEARLSAARVRAVEGVRELVARHAAEAGIANPQGVLVLRAEKDRSAVALAAHRSNLPEPLLAGVAAQSAGLFSDWPEKGEASVAVRLDSLPIPEVPMGTERTYCKPRMANRQEISSALTQFIQGRPALVTRSGSKTKVRFLLTRDGEILAPELKPRSGNYQWDQVALEFVQQVRLVPASVDGVPYDAWTSLPFAMKANGR